MGMSNTNTLPNLSVYAPGNGTLVIRNHSNVQVDESTIRDWLRENKPNLVDYKIYNVCNGSPSYWRLRRAFVNLCINSYDIPNVIRDETTGRVYKVNVDRESHTDHGFNYYSMEVIGAHDDGERYTVKNLGLRQSILAHVNAETVLES